MQGFLSAVTPSPTLPLQGGGSRQARGAGWVSSHPSPLEGEGRGGGSNYKCSFDFHHDSPVTPRSHPARGPHRRSRRARLAFATLDDRPAGGGAVDRRAPRRAEALPCRCPPCGEPRSLCRPHACAGGRRIHGGAAGGASRPPVRHRRTMAGGGAVAAARRDGGGHRDGGVAATAGGATGAPVARRISTGCPWGLAAFALFFALATLPRVGLAPDLDWQSWPGLALLAFGLWGTAELLLGLAFGPMKHAAAGALHLAWHPRPLRFEPGAIESGLRPLDLDAPKLGVETPSDFAWNRLLGVRRLRPMRPLRGRLPRLCRRPAAQSEEADPGPDGGRAPEASDAGYRGSPYPGLTPARRLRRPRRADRRRRRDGRPRDRSGPAPPAAPASRNAR